MPNKTKRTLRPALAIEKEVKRDEISTGLNVGVEKLEGKTTARQPIDNTHNTKYLLKQYRRVAYAVEISESELNLRMEMEHGKRGIWVRSPRSEWRIIADDTRAGSKLYHKNDLHPGKRSSDLLTAYHDQKASYSKLLKYLDYIVEHDYYRMLNPIYPVQHKAPPVKGTKRYRKQLKQQKKKARKDAVRNVLTLIDSLSAPQSKAVTA